MADTNKSVLIKVQLDSKAAKLDGLNAELKETKKQMEYLRKAGQESGDAFDKLDRKSEGLKQKIAALKIEVAAHNKEMQLQQKSMLAVNASYEKLTAQNALLTNANKKLNLSTSAGKQTWEENARIIKRNEDELKRLDATMGRHQRNVGNYKEAIQGAFTKMAGWAAAVTGAVMAVVGAVKRIASSSEESADKFKSYMKGAEFATNAFFLSIKNGDFSNLISGMKEAINLGVKYQEGLTLIEHREIALKYAKAEELDQLSDLELQLKNVNLSHTERFNIGEKWKALSNEIYGREITLSNQLVVIETEKYKLTKANQAEENKIFEMYKKGDLSKKNYDYEHGEIIKKNGEYIKEQIRQLLLQDAHFDARREDAEKYNKLLDDQYDLQIKMFGLTSKGLPISQDLKNQETSLQNDINYYKDKEKIVVDYATLIKQIEGQIPEEQLKATIEAMTQAKEATSLQKRENKRVLNMINTQNKAVKDEEKEKAKTIIDTNKKVNENLRKIEEERLELGRDEYDKEMMQLEFQRKERILNITETKEKEEDINNEFEKKRQIVFQKYLKIQDENTKKVDEELYNNLIQSIENEEKAQEIAATTNIKDQDDLQKALTKIKIDGLNKRLEATKAYYLIDGTMTEGELQNIISLQNEISALLTKPYQDRDFQSQADKELKIFQKKYAKEFEIAQTTGQAISNISNALSDLDAANKEEELRRAGNNAAKQDAINRKYAKIAQDRAIKMAYVDAALAIVNVWASSPNYIVGLIESAAIAVSTGIEIAAMKKQKFFFGGKTLPENAHDTVDIKSRPGEVHLVPEAGRMFPNQINAINQAAGGNQIFAPAINSGSGIMDGAQMANMIIQAVNSMPAPVLVYKEYQDFSKKMVKITDRSRA